MRHSYQFQYWILYGSIYMGFLLGHTIILKNIDGIWIYPDSVEYYESARLPLTDSQFWGGDRSPVILLFYKVFGKYDPESWQHYSYGDDVTLLYGQTMLSLAAFSFLAVTCAKTARTRKGRLSLFVFPLLFSFIPSVVRWNFMALSESFSISLSAVFIAVWILFLSTKRSSWLLGVAIAALLWGGVRDTNAYILVMIAIIIMVAMAASTKIPKILMMLCIWFICIFVLSNFSADAGDRWKFSFYNIIGKRILPIPEYVSYFSNHGMPINPTLLMRTGKWASSDGRAFYNEPHLEEFRIWAANSGKMTYAKFLVTHLLYSTTAPAFELPNDFLSMAFATHIDPSMGYNISVKSPLSSHSTTVSICFLIGISLIAGLAFVLWQRKWLHRFPHLAVPLIMILLSAPHAWLTWHGDAMETARHSLTAFIQFTFGFILFWLYVSDLVHDTRLIAFRSTHHDRHA